MVCTLGCVIVGTGFLKHNQIALDTSAMFIATARLIIGIGIGLFSTPHNIAIMGAVS